MDTVFPDCCGQNAENMSNIGGNPDIVNQGEPMACQTVVETLEAVDGLELYCEVHTCPEPKGVILAVHDYGEHTGVYRSIFSRLCQEGYSVYAADQRGHGKSPGERGLIARFDDYLEDLDLLMARIKDRDPKLPVFLMGQGLGALIATCFAM